MEVKQKKHKLDIFRVLRAIDNREYSFYDSLSEEEKKSFAAVVSMRWMSSSKTVSDPVQMWNILATNTNVNKHMWNSNLLKHPKLIYLTMAMSGIGYVQSHEWIKAPHKKNIGPIFDFIRKLYPTANNTELKLFISINTVDDFVQLAMDMGWPKPDITKLKNELKKLK